jgi:hypothetical protein
MTHFVKKSQVKKFSCGRQSGLVFDSRSKGCGFESCLIQYTRRKGVITMPESISEPNSGSFENKENTGSQMGHANKKIFLEVQMLKLRNN